MRIDAYTIKFLTNAHIGKGGSNIDIVDNVVQKDPINNLPVIYSSSLKGALREHFKEEGTKFLEYIFGSDTKAKTSIQGSFVFFEAFMLTRPVRSNVVPYFNATAPFIIEKFLRYLQEFKILSSLAKELEEFYENIKNIQNVTITNSYPDPIIEEYEDIEVRKVKTPKILGQNIAIFPDRMFKELSLPFIARNHLENGTSKNLWYEEIVPKFSTYVFFIGKPDNIANNIDKEKIEKFENRFDKKGDVVQIGANKTIGYGFAKIERISDA